MSRKTDFKELWDMLVDIHLNHKTDPTTTAAMIVLKEHCMTEHGQGPTMSLLQRAFTHAKTLEARNAEAQKRKAEQT